MIEDNQAASKKYGMDPETREQFEASNTTPTDVAPSRAYSPWIIFINGVICFLKINGSKMEKEER